MTYRFVPHTADIKVVMDGGRLDDIYVDAVALVRELVAGEAADVRPVTAHRIAASAGSADELLLQFIRELLYLFHTASFVPGNLEIEERSPERLRAVVWGELFDDHRHDPQPEVKAVTRHQLAVREEDGRWRAEVIFDL